MRSSLPFLFLLMACATPNKGKVCSPVSSWAAPAYECVAMIQPAPPPPKPEPPPKVEPPPLAA
jgi:hypothetical protein